MWDQITHPANDWFWFSLWSIAVPIATLIVGYLVGLRDGHGQSTEVEDVPERPRDGSRVISDADVQEALDKHIKEKLK